MALTTKQIEYLVEQVGIGPHAELDFNKLKRDVEGAGSRYRSRKMSGSGGTANKRKKWLSHTRSITSQLQEALRDEENVRWFSVRAPATFSTETEDAKAAGGEGTISIMGLIAALGGLQEEISKQLSGRPLNAFELSRSPFEYLAGELMPLIFSSHFKRKAGISRSADNGRPGGPLFRFVRAGVDLLGITHSGKPYADEAIAKAIRDAKSRPTRRKNGASGQKF
ncbi:hypothetical protein [Bradyrhizobium sp. BWC-3-1]|uniref:hypothetical protein n=1 Tax=Bradyrhizobium sp. BWC-3-1 TaxID=3080012 RepID=UPI00293E0367|nr:hypothetical protein [Bradyrhizobium sp. BWC-3-1]WOH58531.1 hypothetical protein RX329_41705 [Bradyrhizobium sp. BWC-3-1]